MTLSKDETPITAAAMAPSTTPPATTDNKAFFNEGVTEATLFMASLMAKEGAAKVAVLIDKAALIFSTLSETFGTDAFGTDET